MPLHVSALFGHLQAEYTIILGSYLTHNARKITPLRLSRYSLIFRSYRGSFLVCKQQWRKVDHSRPSTRSSEIKNPRLYTSTSPYIQVVLLNYAQ
jgi:hypothetical protein